MKTTSIEAFVSSKEQADRHRHKIMRAFNHKQIAMTINEVAQSAGLEYHQVGRRLSELTESNKLKISSQFGLSPTGKRAHKWELV